MSHLLIFYSRADEQVASGGALRTGGPAGVVIAWSIIGVMLVNVSYLAAQIGLWDDS